MEVVAVMPSRTTTNPVIMLTRETQMVRMATMTQGTTLAQFLKTPKIMRVVIKPVGVAIVEDAEAVASIPEDIVITTVVDIMEITKRVVSLTTEADTASITMSTEESKLQLREITTRKKRKKIRLLMAATMMKRIL